MKTVNKKTLSAIVFVVLSLLFNVSVIAAEVKESDVIFVKGRVVDLNTQEPLVCAAVGLESTNLATVTNNEGYFSIKVPGNKSESDLKISCLGYKEGSVELGKLKGELGTIKLEQEVINLSEVKVLPNDPLSLVKGVLANKPRNYSEDPNVMLAFYRETIKKNKSYVGLAEAVVEVYKQPYASLKNDQVRILKGRKGSDVTKMDTLLFKLQGGALTNLMLDVIKDPYMILSQDVQSKYEYTVESVTTEEKQLYYVLAFKQKQNVEEPMFYGKLYIHTETLAVSKVDFSLNTTNKDEVVKMFIKKQPAGVKIQPVEANYTVDYRMQGDKWYFSYSKADLDFKVNWKRKLFNSNYNISSEIAITDRYTENSEKFSSVERVKVNTVMSEQVQGFYDEDFWGKYNVIEPEKSINLAIEKITESMDKLDK